MLGFEGFVLLILFCEREIYTNGMGLPMAFLGFGVLLSILLFFWERREKFYCIGVWSQWATQQEKLLFL
jgi:hypothetical protein